MRFEEQAATHTRKVASRASPSASAARSGASVAELQAAIPLAILDFAWLGFGAAIRSIVAIAERLAVDRAARLPLVVVPRLDRLGALRLWLAIDSSRDDEEQLAGWGDSVGGLHGYGSCSEAETGGAPPAAPKEG